MTRLLAWGGGLSAAVVVAALGACLPQATGDFALCCTCLDQKSPVNGGDALSPAENCLPDTGEADQCNQEAADKLADPGGAHPIHVVDEGCAVTTCQEECNGAKIQGATFEVADAAP
jgi:hypothetical protein